MNVFTHLDDKQQPRMVSVGDKMVTRRTAKAETLVHLPDIIAEQFREGDLHTKKGSVFQTSIVAGIMGAKKTHELIPMCHPLGLEKCDIQMELLEGNVVQIRSEVSVTHKTGVEMEALTASSIAALTLYDMCKGISQELTISSTRLLEKTGGKSDLHRLEENP